MLVLGLAWYAGAQAPYTHSLGVTFGNMEAFSYKIFLTDNIAISADVGFKWTLTRATYHEKGTNYIWRGSTTPMTIELNPNIMYESPAGRNNLYWFAGAGLSAGYAWSNYQYEWGVARISYGKFGMNAIGGVEYKFKFPLTLQADFRPGFGLLFNHNYNVTYFDWGIFVGARYTIR